MNLTRKDGKDYTTFASIMNKHCDDFKLTELSANNFKCLIFVHGLVSFKDAEISSDLIGKRAKPYSPTNSGRLSEIPKRTPRLKEYRRIWHCTNKRYVKRKNNLIFLQNKTNIKRDKKT